MKRKLGSSFAVALAGQVLSNLQGLLVLPLVIKLAGTASYGAFVLINTTVVVALGLVGTLTTYRYRRSLVSADDAPTRRRLFEPQFTIQLIVLALLVALAASTDVEATAERWLEIAGLTFPALALMLVSTFVLRQVQDYYKYTHRFIAGSVLNGGRPVLLLAGFAAAALMVSSLSLGGLLTLYATATLALSLPFVPKMLSELGGVRLRLSGPRHAEDIRLGYPFAGELMLDFLLGFSDRWLICLFLTVADVGRYQPACILGGFVIGMVTLADAVLEPTLARMIDEGRRREAERLFDGFLGAFLMIGVAFAVGALMVGPSLLALITNREIGEAGLWVVPLVALGSIFYGVMRLAALIAYVVGRTRAILTANIIGAATTLTLNLAILPWIPDLWVPAAAMAIAYAAGGIYVVRALRPAWPLTVDWGSVVRYAASGLAMAALLWGLGFRPGLLFSGSSLALVAAVPAGAAAYFAALALMGGIGRKEVAFLALLFHGAPRAASPA
jgi:O-antigen/teichoic acid export membrane protein